jgi:hypothetical protein
LHSSHVDEYVNWQAEAWDDDNDYYRIGDSQSSQSEVYISEFIAPPDFVAPTSGVSSLAAYCMSSSLSVAYTATDAGSGVGFVELYYRLGTSGPFLKYSTTGNPTGHWTSSPITFDTADTGGDGEYQFYTRATDVFGNVEPAPGIEDSTTIVDTVAPSTTHSCTGTSGSGGWYVSDSVSVSLMAADSTSGVSSTVYRLNQGDWKTYSGAFSVGDEGTTTVEFYSVDTAGNSESHKYSALKIDRSCPSLTINQANGTSFNSSSVTISWICTDAASGLAQLEYSLDNGAFKSCTGESLALTNVGDGAHTITMRGTDNAGNAVERTLTFDVNTNVSSMSGPIGPWLNIGLIIVALAVVLVLILVLRRRRGA